MHAAIVAIQKTKIPLSFLHSLWQRADGGRTREENTLTDSKYASSSKSFLNNVSFGVTHRTSSCRFEWNVAVRATDRQQQQQHALTSKNDVGRKQRKKKERRTEKKPEKRTRGNEWKNMEKVQFPSQQVNQNKRLPNEANGIWRRTTTDCHKLITCFFHSFVKSADAAHSTSHLWQAS